jgi:hypothetical protein
VQRWCSGGAGVPQLCRGADVQRWSRGGAEVVRRCRVAEAQMWWYGGAEVQVPQGSAGAGAEVVLSWCKVAEVVYRCRGVQRCVEVCRGAEVRGAEVKRWYRDV